MERIRTRGDHPGRSRSDLLSLLGYVAAAVVLCTLLGLAIGALWGISQDDMATWVGRGASFGASIGALLGVVVAIWAGDVDR